VNALRNRFRLLKARDVTSATTADEAGFSLIEVVVALFTFAIIASGTAYTMLSVLQVSRDSRARHVATNLAAQEIDLARDAADLLTLTDLDRDPVQLNGDIFHISRATRWVASTGLDDSCGAAAGTLSYKRVNVSVSWDGMRRGSVPVRADTVITPSSHLTNLSQGSILVAVTGASGAGVAGIAVSATPDSPGNGAVATGTITTDSQGCAFLLGVTPGNYRVSAVATGHLDSLAQAAAPVVRGVVVVAGSATAASFEYDRASVFSVKYAENLESVAPGIGTVYFPRALDTTSFAPDGRAIASNVTSPAPGTTANSTRVRPLSLFPFSAGYQSIAGKYVPASVVAPSTPSCLSVDPAAWPAVTAAGVTRTGIRPAAVATLPGAPAEVKIPMGIATLGLGTAATSLRATSAPATAGSGNPGCSVGMTYNFGDVPATATIALPYGAWQLTTGSGAGTTVPAGRITVRSTGTVSPAGVVTFDPRQVAP